MTMKFQLIEAIKEREEKRRRDANKVIAKPQKIKNLQKPMKTTTFP
jgi:hypothetical protein